MDQRNLNNPNQNNMGFNGGYPGDMQNMYFSDNQNACFNFFIGTSANPPPPPPTEYGAGFQTNYQGGQSVMVMEPDRNTWMSRSSTMGTPSSHFQMSPNPSNGSYQINGYSTGGVPMSGMGYNLDQAPRSSGRQQPVVLVIPPESGHQCGHHHHHEPGYAFHQQAQAQRQPSYPPAAFGSQGPSSFIPVGNRNPNNNPPMMTARGLDAFLIRPTSSMSNSSFTSGSSLGFTNDFLHSPPRGHHDANNN